MSSTSRFGLLAGVVLAGLAALIRRRQREPVAAGPRRSDGGPEPGGVREPRVPIPSSGSAAAHAEPPIDPFEAPEPAQPSS